MKILGFLTILTLLLTSTTIASLDTYDCECSLITVFRFESTEFDFDNEIIYTEGYGLKNIIYTKYLDTYYLYINGESMSELFSPINPLLRIFTGDYTTSFIGDFQGSFTGNIYVGDEVTLL